ncbi:MAG TPA: hypothetical protein PLS83_07425 [Methanothrix soehngenii]|nr:hypothetical protein [Methanothrix soehngenii]
MKRAAFFRPIVRGEMTREGDGEILVEFAGRESPMDLSGLTNRGLSGATSREEDAPSPSASAPPVIALLKRELERSRRDRYYEGRSGRVAPVSKNPEKHSDGALIFPQAESHSSRSISLLFKISANSPTPIVAL